MDLNHKFWLRLCHKIVTSQTLAPVELVGKDQVKQNSLEPRFKNVKEGLREVS